MSSVTHTYTLLKPSITSLLPTDDPADFARCLLQHHRLAPALPFSAGSTETTQVSEQGYHIGEPLVSIDDNVADDWVEDEIQTALIEFARATLVPLAISPADRDALVELESFLEQASARARKDSTRLHDGELGLSHCLCLTLIEPVNAILDLVTLENPLARPYVRFVGTGRAGKPDIELVCDSGTLTPIGKRLQVLATFELKTSLAVPPDQIEAIPAYFESHAVTFDAFSGKVRWDPIVGPTGKFVELNIVQLLSRKCRYGLGFNDQRMISFRNVNGRIAVGKVINMSATCGRSNLPGSPLGLFTGVCLAALRHLGLWVPHAADAQVALAQAAGQGGQAGGSEMDQGNEELEGGLGGEGGNGDQRSSQETIRLQGRGRLDAKMTLPTLHDSFLPRPPGLPRDSRIVFPPSPPSPGRTGVKFDPAQAGSPSMPIVSLDSPLTPPNSPPYRVRLDELGTVLLRLDWTKFRLTVGDSIGPVHQIPNDILAARGPFDPIQSGLRALPDLYSTQKSALDADDQQLVEVLGCRSYGARWNVFAAQMTVPNTPKIDITVQFGDRPVSADFRNIQVVLKVCDLSLFPRQPCFYEYDRPVRDEVSRAVVNEFRALTLIGQSAEGSIVPRLLGLFGYRGNTGKSDRYTTLGNDGIQDEAKYEDDRGRTCWMLVLEDVGWSIPVESRHLPVVQKRVLAQYARLHGIGVLHGDVEWRHVLCSHSVVHGLDPRLIDFDRARFRHDMGKSEWEAAVAEELRRVRYMLDAAV